MGRGSVGSVAALHWVAEEGPSEDVALVSKQLIEQRTSHAKVWRRHRRQPARPVQRLWGKSRPSKVPALHGAQEASTGAGEWEKAREEAREGVIWGLWVSVKMFDFPGGSDTKVSAYNEGDPGSIPGLGRSPGERNGNPLQYSWLENPMDGESWQATVHGVTKSRTDWATSLSSTWDRKHFKGCRDKSDLI